MVCSDPHLLPQKIEMLPSIIGFSLIQTPCRPIAYARTLSEGDTQELKMQGLISLLQVVRTGP